MITWPRMLIFICAIVGLWIGGTSGLLLGAAVGFVISRVVEGTVQRGLLEVRLQFVETTFAVMGALCKADGVVTRDEIRVTEQIFGAYGALARADADGEGRL